MKSRGFTVFLLLIFIASLSKNTHASNTPSNASTALVYIRIDSQEEVARFAALQLPLYANLEKGFLTAANSAVQETLLDAGLIIQVLDPDLHPGTYYLAQAHPNRVVIINYRSFGRVLLDLGNFVLLSVEPSRIGALAEAGAELQAISLTPKPLPFTQIEQVVPEVVNPDPTIQGMINQVSATQVDIYDKQLAGQLPVWVDDTWNTIITRYTLNGSQIQKATNFVGQHLEDLGIHVEYHQWSSESVSYRNVIGEITGTTHPEDIYIIGAHLDDVQGTPGADDNASGSVATLIAADILSQYQWGCTLRFAFWTGEEQGLRGSAAYAKRSYLQEENIQSYLNLDMIAWNTLNSDPYINLIYSDYVPASHDLALRFADVISAYNLDLLTRLGTGILGSDHSSFLNYGFNSILAIEDEIGGDFNPKYHSPNDTPSNTNLVYFTNFVKASIAAFAHETNCLIPPENGTLNGQVTDGSNGLPINGAVVDAENTREHVFHTNTNSSGSYSMPLPVDTYTVTVSAHDYLTSEVDGQEVITNTSTTLDFSLQPYCEPVGSLNFSWSPLEPFNGNPVTFTTTVTGTDPFDFEWSFGDAQTGSGANITHTYNTPGTYKVLLSASNACSIQDITRDLKVLLHFDYFLPWMSNK